MERSEGRTLFVIIVIPSGDIRPVLLGQSATAFSREMERRAFPFPQDIKSSRRASNVGPSRYARMNLLSFCDRPDSTPLPLLCLNSRIFTGGGEKTPILLMEKKKRRRRLMTISVSVARLRSGRQGFVLHPWELVGCLKLLPSAEWFGDTPSRV